MNVISLFSMDSLYASVFYALSNIAEVNGESERMKGTQQIQRNLCEIQSIVIFQGYSGGQQCLDQKMDLYKRFDINAILQHYCGYS